MSVLIHFVKFLTLGVVYSYLGVQFLLSPSGGQTVSYVLFTFCLCFIGLRGLELLCALLGFH